MKAGAVALLLAALAAPALAQAPASGQYEGLLLAVSPDGTVRGAFSEQRVGNGSDAAPQFSCRFLLRGRLSDGRGVVETWFPGQKPIPGNLSFEGGGASLMLREDQDGCAMTAGGMTQQPWRAPRDAPGEGWTGAALVTAPRAAFRPSPGAAAPRTPYVVEGDALAVLERRGDWVRARYTGAARPVTGWFPVGELALAADGP